MQLYISLIFLQTKIINGYRNKWLFSQLFCQINQTEEECILFFPSVTTGGFNFSVLPGNQAVFLQCSPRGPVPGQLLWDTQALRLDALTQVSSAASTEPSHFSLLKTGIYLKEDSNFPYCRLLEEGMQLLTASVL